MKLTWIKNHRGIILFITIVAVILASIVSGIVSFLNSWRYGLNLYTVDGFFGDYFYYRHLAGEMYEHFEEAGEGIVRVHIEPSLEDYFVRYYYEDETLNRVEEHRKSELEYDCFKEIAKAFMNCDYGHFYGITIMEGQVAFRREAPYAIVYTMNGFKPKYYANSETDKLYVKRISPHWFHCVNID